MAEGGGIIAGAKRFIQKVIDTIRGRNGGGRGTASSVASRGSRGAAGGVRQAAAVTRRGAVRAARVRRSAGSAAQSSSY